MLRIASRLEMRFIVVSIVSGRFSLKLYPISSKTVCTNCRITLLVMLRLANFSVDG